MNRIKFNKKTKVSLRTDYITMIDNPDEEILDGYVPDIKAFPFAIAHTNDPKFKYWLVVNRFSGKPFLIRFQKKKEAENFFYIFASLYDVNDIEFKNPKSKFDYRSASFTVYRKTTKQYYDKTNFGV